jgi:hypothetical protein
MGQGHKEFWRKNRLKILFDFRGNFVYDTTTKRQNTDHKNYALHNRDPRTQLSQITVVLPAPLGPINAWIWPRFTLKLILLTAMKPLNSLTSSLVSKMIS